MFLRMNIGMFASKSTFLHDTFFTKSYCHHLHTKSLRNTPSTESNSQVTVVFLSNPLLLSKSPMTYVQSVKIVDRVAPTHMLRGP